MAVGFREFHVPDVAGFAQMLGEPTEGTWTILVSDLDDGNVGTFTSFTVSGVAHL